MRVQRTEPRIGVTLVHCPSCREPRWHGYGRCSTCGAAGTADPAHLSAEAPGAAPLTGWDAWYERQRELPPQNNLGF